MSRSTTNPPLFPDSHHILFFLLFSSKQTPHLSDLLLFKVKLMTILSITRVVWRLQQMSRPTSRSPSRLRQPAPGNSELQPVLLDEEEEEKEDNDNNNDNVNLHLATVSCNPFRHLIPQHQPVCIKPSDYLINVRHSSEKFYF